MLSSSQPPPSNAGLLSSHTQPLTSQASPSTLQSQLSTSRSQPSTSEEAAETQPPESDAAPSEAPTDPPALEPWRQPESKVAATQFKLILELRFDSPYDSWITVPQPVQDMRFAEFSRYFCWDSQLNTEARDGFGATAVKRYRQLMHNMHIASKKPAWIPYDVYDGLWAKWDDPQAKCEQASKNRRRLLGAYFSHDKLYKNLHDKFWKLKKQKEHERRTTGAFLPIATS
ncbi:hypothetical protein M9H77_35046 [Catharanthus roseus]|uniref:Uncharacterized protein n=1 Tax=Catharanthus roseus TaxID=4058 RepID=A0ACB9ZMW3_CATRO|nr:hypothetical protein M9H77_35046 [Catharanthus roseus]